jgi:uncharacterized coiled-coil DUF342 family protein
MGLTIIRKDSIKNRRQKTRAELQAENEALKAKMQSLEEEVDNTNLALCDVYEQMLNSMETADESSS